MNWTETPGPPSYDFRSEQWSAHVRFDFDHWEWEVIEIDTRNHFGGTASSAEEAMAAAEEAMKHLHDGLLGYSLNKIKDKYLPNRDRVSLEDDQEKE